MIETEICGPAGTEPPSERLQVARAQLLLRRVVGYVGLALPTGLLLAEVTLLDQPVAIRDSLSSYYHSGARDVFVGAMFVVGLALITYLGLRSVLTTVAGVAAIGVALIPTARPTGSDLPLPPVADYLGEDTANVVHLVCAAVFILALGGICLRTFVADRALTGGPVAERVAARAWIHACCGVVILAAVGFIAVGELGGLGRIGDLTPLYLGEVVAVYSFGVSWLIKARDLRLLLVEVRA